jgi:hypothetical protein
MTESTVTKKDRDAAVNAYYICYESTCYDYEPSSTWIDALIGGRLDDDNLIQAFARHREQARAAGLAEGVALGIEAGARYVQDNYPHDKRALVPAIRNLDPAAIIAARAVGTVYVPVGDSDGDDGA